MSNFIVGIDTKDVYIGREKPEKTAAGKAVKKGGAGMNSHSGVNSKKIEEKVDGTDAPLVHKQVNRKLSVTIAQARQAKKMTQKELANKICERQQLIAEYESGSAIPSEQVLIKMERALGVRLRGVK
ncbi:multiprotein-bridging factor, putative [Entamoeba invadens IP1]|uniref:Multiprotein-bridging factor, putative n=1 Tax=Entamoeba invadens IP1 TaxID=370355 RepID=A0A0A1UAJ1_ENTIV|nr:multiprotein-bridging factor, putative [Entamoeba invadens IP1]ELP92078.1 multiprotein-bridging factor, putative [Entamoeba invadens IP1]|eukprot:XP_004258849.1 multiprotein-bridging factor, putative [Entamoeba invadens IP1]